MPTPPDAVHHPLRVLLVEDSELDAQLVISELEQGGYDLTFERVQTAAALEDALGHQAWDLVLSDHNMPQFNSAAALGIVKARNPDVPFIIVSGSIGEELAVASMREGASDYILKDNLRRLVPAIERELREAEHRRERRRAERALLAQEEQLRIARDIQRRMFPRSPPRIPGWTLAGGSQPADATGGDYYDYVSAQGGLIVAVGDVSGHGLGAALLMAETRECLRALALSCRDAREILTRAAPLLMADFGDDNFITLFLGQLDPVAGRLDWTSAGHPPGFIFGPDGALRAELPAAMPAMGLSLPFGDCPPPQAALIEPGDMLVLVTDGVLEALNAGREEFGFERVCAVVRRHADERPDALVRRVFDAVLEHQGEEPQMDDMTVVVLRRERKVVR